MSLLEPLEEQLVTIAKALEQLDVCRDKISDQRATIETGIHNTITRLHEALDVRKTNSLRPN